MKKIFLSSLFLTILFQSCNSGSSETTDSAGSVEHKKEEAKEDIVVGDGAKLIEGYTYYGIKEFTPDGAVSMTDMMNKLEATGSFEGKVNAKLAGVCQTAGCWVTLENPNGEPIRVFFGAHDFFVPTDTEVGKEVVLEGATEVDTFTIEFQKHLLDDEIAAGETVSQDAYDAITEDKIQMSFVASGILLKP